MDILVLYGGAGEAVVDAGKRMKSWKISPFYCSLYQNSISECHIYLCCGMPEYFRIPSVVITTSTIIILLSLSARL